MPAPGMRWRHVIINTKGSWLHVDARGFRSRGHRIHSSGDYKHRPPPGEHSGLLRHMEEQCPEEITLDNDLRPLIGRAMVATCVASNIPLLAVAVGKVHALPSAASKRHGRDQTVGRLGETKSVPRGERSFARIDLVRGREAGTRRHSGTSAQSARLHHLRSRTGRVDVVVQGRDHGGNVWTEEIGARAKEESGAALTLYPGVDVLRERRHEHGA